MDYWSKGVLIVLGCMVVAMYIKREKIRSVINPFFDRIDRSLAERSSEGSNVCESEWSHQAEGGEVFSLKILVSSTLSSDDAMSKYLEIISLDHKGLTESKHLPKEPGGEHDTN